MKSYLTRLLGVTGLCLWLLCDSFSCSLFISPISGFDAQEFVFIGKVIGHVGPYEGDKIAGKAWGVRVSIKEKVALPQIPLSGNFEVFNYGLGADCSYTGMGENITKQAFPLNSEVRVVAKLAKNLSGSPTPGDIRLEITPSDMGGLDRNDRDGKAETTAHSVFKYSVDEGRNWLRVLFEIRKDLVRLETSKTNKERKRILQRLEPIRYHHIIDYDLVSTYYDREINVDAKIKPRKKV